MSTTAPPAPAEIDPRRNLQVERLLTEWQLPFTLVDEIALDAMKIDRAVQVRAAANIAPRMRVEEYAQQMKNGALFPPVVIDEKDRLLDGNTRLGAARECKKLTLPAYRVKTNTDEMSIMVSGALNQMGGQRLELAEASKVAFVMMGRGYTDSAIALTVGRHVTQVRRWKQQDQTLRRAGDMKIDMSAVPKRALEHLDDIGHDEPFKEAAKLVSEVGLSEKATLELVRAMQQSTSDAEAIAKVSDLRLEIAAAGPPPPRANTAKALQQARMHLGGLLRLATEPPAALCETLADRDKWTQARDLAVAVLAAAAPAA